MKYSYEYKRKCVEMYREGKWPETPEGIQERNFHEIIRKWFRIEESCGPDALRHKMQNKVWAVEEKYELVAKVMAGASYKETAISSGIEDSLLRQWVKRYKIEGYEGLVRQRRGRPPKEASMKKKAVPAELTPSEREEKNEMFYGHEKKYTSFEIFSKAIADYIDYYNNRRIQAKTKWMPPAKFREASMMKN